jgi:hypothetical protein
MEGIRISALGGCHVAGYPYEVKQAFPSLLAAQVHGEVVERIVNLQFVKLPKHLPAIGTLHPSHVLLQLGNYEFCASATTILKQVRRSLGLKSTSKKSSESTASTVSATQPASFLGQLLMKTKLYVRVVTLGLITSLLWLCSSQHRRTFRALNACMRQHPNTVFLFLAPFPHLDPAVNALRQLGSWLMRRRIASAPNFYWFDSHQLIERDPAIFYDLGHLNEEGHRYLANKLAVMLPALEPSM